jgi:hypothetical protein
MFQAMQVHYQTFSCTVQALWHWYRAHSPNHKTASIALYLLHCIKHIDDLPWYHMYLLPWYHMYLDIMLHHNACVLQLLSC